VVVVVLGHGTMLDGASPYRKAELRSQELQNG
jgi:hypothetical protein